MSVLVKSQTVLKLSKRYPARVVFEQEPENRNEMRLHAIGIDRKVWEEMGSPEVITVTFEPGDKLNESS
jgi:hypothetical protein